MLLGGIEGIVRRKRLTRNRTQQFGSLVQHKPAVRGPRPRGGMESIREVWDCMASTSQVPKVVLRVTKIVQTRHAKDSGTGHSKIMQNAHHLKRLNP